MLSNVEDGAACDGRKDRVGLRCYDCAVFCNEDEVCSACLFNIGSCTGIEVHILIIALFVSINDGM